MSYSRIIGIISGLGALASGLAVTINVISPKWGGILAGVGGAIAMFTERATGGLSQPDKRLDAAMADRRDEAQRP